jgi:threonine dehydrogenase-like Zn-dependent dehydrogenase
VSDDQAIMLSDIFPTAYFGAKLAEIENGDTVAVFGCGPVGLFAIVSARLLGAGRVFAVDAIPTRLAAARVLGAEVVNFDEEDPVEVILRLTNGIGVDRAIDAVGVDANAPIRGPASRLSPSERDELAREVTVVAPQQHPDGDNWHPGDAPSQALAWAVNALAKAGTLGIIGVSPESARSFPIGIAMNKNLALNMGNCHHRKYIPRLIELVESGIVDPSEVLSQREPIVSAIEAYRAFDRRQAGWLKVELLPEEDEASLAA